MWRKLMLRNSKQKRIQRLIGLRVCDGDGAECGPETSDAVRKDRGGDELERTVRDVLNTLDLDSLKMLCEVIESRGDTLGSCVVVPKNEYVLRSKSATGVVLFCRYFRWPGVGCELRLRRLFVCEGGEDDCHVCINPYHWSQIYTQVSESPPPPVAGARRPSAPAEHLLSGGASETVTPVSETTGGTEQTGGSDSSFGGPCHTWCRLLYLEQRRRVGPVGGWSARAAVQHVFFSLPHEDGISLEAVVGQNPRPESDVLQTRTHIGAGLTLSLETAGVWLYNRSQWPLFVSSPTLDPPSGSPAEAVHKLPPGFSVLVFTWTEDERRRQPPDARDGPRDPYTAVVSFAKGWGPKYKRRNAIQCPCRLELCFSLPTTRRR